MGVDLQTYRAKIGTFRHSVGTDVLTIVCCVNFSGGLKSVGSVVFIGLLLLIAGIESNPGPKDNDNEDQTSVKPTAIKITGLPSNVDAETLESIFEDTKRKGGGPVKETSFDPSTLTAVIEFENAKAVEIVLSKRPISIMSTPVNVEIYYGKLQETLSTSSEFESIRSDDGSDEYVNKSEEMRQCIYAFGLEKHFEEKISLRDALIIDQYETEVVRHYAIRDLPLLILKQLMSANSSALDLSVYKLESGAEKNMSRSSEDCATPRHYSTSETFKVSPLDLFVIAFQSCYPDLKQIICQKLYLCKLAIPFLYYNFGTNETVVSIWPLRSVVVQSNVITNGKVTMAENDVLQMPTYTVTFARFGRPSYSKSKLLNSILSVSETNTFFNEECFSGSVPKNFANGYAEIFWVPAVVDINFEISTPLTYLNLRGDIAHDFSDQHLSLFSSLSDILVLCVDQGIVLKSADILNNQFRKFHFVLLIVNNPSCRCDKLEIERMFLALNKTKQVEYHFDCVLTHSDSPHEINQRKVRNYVSKYIYTCLTSKSLKLNPIPFEIRLSLCSQLVSTDETQDYKHAKGKAEEVFKAMKEVYSEHTSLETVTLVQSKYSKRLGELLKELHSSKRNIDDIEHKIVEERTKQMKDVNPIIEQFIIYLNSFADQPIAMYYFLSWLKIFIEREQRQTVLQLKERRTKLENKCLLLKKNKLYNAVTLKRTQQKVKEVEDKLEKSNFGISNLFREIAHIYDAVIILQTTPDSPDLPSVERVVYIFANLFVNGYIIELLDSCSLYMPMAWIKAVFNKVHNIIDKKKVFSLSVLGLQSSGKSTLLNTMFGVHNPTQSGRCTRGITAQLVPISLTTTTKENVFDYLLVIDTEGLRAPEFKEEIYKRDNRIATMITGFGDISIINIMGENTTEIRDVLQAIVHAFLRLHLSNPKVDIKKRCIFIHQNVADEAALENMRTGLKSSVEMLDMATEEAAESEGISNIKTFDQVIAFDMNSDVKYIPHLWQGNPPMANVNQKYCQKVILTRQYFLKNALKEHAKSYKTLEDVAVGMDNLWTGVLSEDFVFTFRNSLEKKAYASLERVLKEQIWELEHYFEQEVHNICKNIFSECETEQTILEGITRVTLKTEETIKFIHELAHKKLTDYFSHNAYQELTIQWKQKTIIQLQNSVDDIFMKRQSVVHTYVHRKLVEIELRRIHSHTAAALYQRSISLASKLKDKNLDISEIDSEFDNVWASVVNNCIDTTKSSPKCELRPIFIKWLNSTFSEHPVLNKVLEQRNVLKSTPDVEHFTDTFSITDIDDNDFDFMQTDFNSRPSSAVLLENVKEMLNVVFRETDQSIIKYKQIDNEVTEGDIRKFLFDFQKLTERQFKKPDEYIIVNTAFNVKLFVHVSHIACHIFEKHNKQYQDTHGITAQLQKSKQQCKDLFNIYLRERRTEATASDYFRNMVESFLKNLIEDRSAMLTKKELKPLLPSSKMKLIVELLRELVEKNDFELFYIYLTRPSFFAGNWVTQKCQLNLFSNNNSMFRKIVLHDIEKYIDDLYHVLKKSETKFHLGEEVNIDAWVDFLKKEVTYCMFSEGELQMLKAQFVNNSSVNCEQFQRLLLEQMEHVKTNIDLYLQSVTKDTVRWRGYNPYDELFKELWGCYEQCMFCGEPCMHETDGHATDHECMQHRPKGLVGNRLNVSGEINLKSCSYDVATDKESACAVFRYACSGQTNRDCQKRIHEFREYKRFFKTWDIEPNKKTEDKLFWQWFIYNYKENLKKQYRCTVANVPSKWSKISEQKAIENLKDLYLLQFGCSICDLYLHLQYLR